MTTRRQKAAIRFCEQWLNITFNGNIDSRIQVSNFLDIYLDEAKEKYDWVTSSYNNFIMDKNWEF